MADITKCTGVRIDALGKRKTTICPFRAKCERYTRPASDDRQSWFVVVPLVTDENGKHSCDERKSHWTEQTREAGSTVIAHAFEPLEGAVYCKKCGMPKANHP